MAGYLLIRGILTRLVIALQASVLSPVLTSAPAAAGQEAVAERCQDDPVTEPGPVLPRFLGSLAPLLDHYGVAV